MKTIKLHIHTVSLTIFQSFNLPLFHSSNLIFFQSNNLPLFHLSTLPLFYSSTLDVTRVVKGHMKVSFLSFSSSKLKAKTTELHPEIRPTCFTNWLHSYTLHIIGSKNRRKEIVLNLDLDEDNGLWSAAVLRGGYKLIWGQAKLLKQKVLRWR